MKLTRTNYQKKAAALAVEAALISLMIVPAPARAEDGDADVAALTRPTNTVSVGVASTANGSDKYSEYSGLSKSGVDPVINFALKGGNSYGMDTGTLQWNAFGTDLGLKSQAVGGSIGEQGSWNVGISFDQLRHNITDSYSTPYQGSMGGNTFTLPSNFGIIQTSNPAPNNGTANQAVPYGTQTLSAIQKGAFQNQDVYTERKNSGFNAGYNFNALWNVQFEYNHLAQDGAKLISAASSQPLVNTAFNGGALNLKGQAIVMLMNPTNYTTDTFNLAFNWKGDKSTFTGGFYGSLFRDGYNGLNFANPYVGATGANNVAVVANANAHPNGSAMGIAYPMNTLSTAPDNDFYQMNLKGTYAFSATVKGAGSFSYGRNTQNTAYNVSEGLMQTGGLPASSLDGLVVTTHADVKLTDQETKDLTLGAGFKYNERDNRTPSSTYKFVSIGGAAETAVNTPMSNRKEQLDFGGDYRISKDQSLHLGYEYEKIERWCNNGLANNAQSATVVAAYPGYYTDASCAQVPSSGESKLNVNYKVKPADEWTFNLGYGFGDRRSTVNQSFYNPMQASNQGLENLGYIAFFDASRKQNIFKANVNWQPTDRLSFMLGLKKTDDSYLDSTLGVQNGHSLSVNMDVTYAWEENTSVSMFVSTLSRDRGLITGKGNSPVTVNTTLWTNSLDESDITWGFGGKKGGLLGGKLDLAADLTYSIGKSTYATNTLYACPAWGSTGNDCGEVAPIYNRSIQFKLAGNYMLDKASKVLMGYVYQKLDSNDYYYNAYQFGTTPTSLLPTGQQNPSYSASTVYAAYQYSFQ